LPEIVTDIGAYAGIASVVGLAVLSALYFSQARDVKRLREWAGRAPERSEEGAPALPGRVVAQPQQQQPSTAARPVPVPTPAKPAAATPAAAAAAGAGPATAQQNKPSAPPVPAGATANAGAAASGPSAAPSGGPSGSPPAAKPGSGASDGAGADAEKPGADAGAAKPDGEAEAAKPDGEAEASKPAAQAAGTATPSAPSAPSPSAPSPSAPSPGGPSPSAPSPASPSGSPPVVPGRPPQPPAAPPRQAPAATPAGSRGTPPSPPSGESRFARPGVTSRHSPQETAILPPRPKSSGGLTTRYLIVVLVGLLVLGSAAAYGVIQLTQDDDGTPASQNGSGDASDGNGSGKQKRKQGGAVKPANVTVAVLNGTTVPGLAATLSDEVDAAGFKVGTITNFSDQQLAESVVQYVPGHEAEARAVSRRLGIDQREPVSPTSQALAGDATVVVIAGADKAP
jgi:LytR cell envelope-related transcriptional attenuator